MYISTKSTIKKCFPIFKIFISILNFQVCRCKRVNYRDSNTHVIHNEAFVQNKFPK